MFAVAAVVLFAVEFPTPAAALLLDDDDDVADVRKALGNVSAVGGNGGRLAVASN